MQPLILGLAALSIGLMVLRLITSLGGRVQGPQAKRMAGGLLMGLAALLLVRGMLPLAFAVAIAGLWLLAGLGFGVGSFGGPQAAKGRQSTVKTEHLEMELDLDSSRMRGRVLKGFFRGRKLEDMSPVELAHFWQDCRFVDPQSAQLVEAYLDRVHPTWRDDLARAEAETPKGSDGRMTLEEALEILGLKAGASEADIKRAHRELMLRLHPDRGGSHYLAAKINEAKDVALAALPK